MKQKKLIILILTKNEEQSIASVVIKCKGWAHNVEGFESFIAIVDDSRDRTRQLAEQAGAIVVAGEGLGLGHSYMLGVEWALGQGADWIFTIDGDGQSPLEELSSYWKAKDTSGADFILGSRFLKDGMIHYQYPTWNRFGVYLLSSALSIFSGRPITDSHGGIRLFSRDVAKSFRLYGRHTYVQETILTAAQQNFEIIEVVSAWKKRPFGESRVVKSKLKYAWRTVMPLLLTGSQTLWRRVSK